MTKSKIQVLQNCRKKLERAIKDPSLYIVLAPSSADRVLPFHEEELKAISSEPALQKTLNEAQKSQINMELESLSRSAPFSTPALSPVGT